MDWDDGTRGALLQSPEDLGSSLRVEAHTDQLAGGIVQCPGAAVLPDRHTVSPLEEGQSPQALPGGLLAAFTPAVRRLVAVPRAAVFAVLELEGNPVLLAVWRVVCGRRRDRKLLEDRCEPCQQPALITVT